MTDQFSPLRPAYARLVLWWICLLVAWGAFTGLVVWALTVGRSMMWQDVGIGASAMAGTFAIWRVRVHGVRRATPDETGLSQDLIRLQKVTSLGRLARGVTHDLNNLLVPILGNAELLSGGTDLTDDVRRRIGDVHHAAEVASALLRQVQVYAGEDTSSVEPVDLNELVIEIESLLRAATPRNVAMEFDLAESSLLINADRCQVRQVIVNLVENAAEAMAGRKGTVTVRTASAEMTASQCASMGLRPGQHVIMEVVDVGCGMDEHVQAMLFEPFFTTRSPGRGLGMTVARDIMIGHSGGIDLQSQVDQGTTIRLVFPRVTGTVAARGTPVAGDG
jgi:two-component system cell cycle sensor histidine kinase/response regulator CckA